MTIEALKNKIAQYVLARKKAEGDAQEQMRINDKLSKLYNLYYLAIVQEKERKREKK